MSGKVKITGNKNSARELAKSIQKNLRRKGIDAKVASEDVRKLQRGIDKLGR